MSRVGRLDVISGVPVSPFRSSLRAMGMQPEPFVFEPAKAYSERLTKSIDGLWKLKEVFELGGTAQRPYPWECRRQLSSIQKGVVQSIPAP
jgi:hypothetical protein